MYKKRAATRRSAKKSTAAVDRKAPWNRENPKPDSGHKSLTPQAKAAAKHNAKKAGRPYPNLVDNMRAAAESKKQ